MHTVLIVDDEEKLREVLVVALENMGYDTVTAGTGEEAQSIIERTDVHLVLCDLRMPGMGGRELLKRIKVLRPDLPMIIMTAYASLKDAVEIIKDGAFDYIAKPFDLDVLEATAASALRYYTLSSDNAQLRKELGKVYSFEQMIGTSAPFRATLQSISEVCESNANVLITGESGTGKELVARAIHFNSSRKAAPFVALNCAAIPENLLESELFGHVKGAFTGAVSNHAGRLDQANGGTLFLDEIGDMSLSLQAKILRCIQEKTFEAVGSHTSRKVDVRFIAATNQDLDMVIANGGFRQDLYYRINVFPIVLPPLRERIDDVPLLAKYFAERNALEMGKPSIEFTPEAFSAMQKYAWPGNIRELQNCVERTSIVHAGKKIYPVDLPDYILTNPDIISDNNALISGVALDLEQELAIVERKLILAALEKTQGVQVKAAALLNISERSMWHRIKKLGIVISTKKEIL